MKSVSLCRYEREGKVGGHWCNLCPPLKEYFAIEKREALEFAEKNRRLKNRKSGRKNVRH